MQPNRAGGHENGSGDYHNSGQSETQNPISRPFTLQESLPYSPQTTTVPLVPEIYPDPLIGSTSSTLDISQFFSKWDYDKFNTEVMYNNGHFTRSGKQAVDLVLHDLKPSQRTNYIFKRPQTHASSSTSNNDISPILKSDNGASTDITNSSSGKSLAQDLSPFARAVYDKVGGYFKATKALTASPQGLKFDGEKARTPSKEAVSQSPFLPQPVSRIKGRNERQESPKANAYRIEVAIPSRSNFDQSAYVDVMGAQMPPNAPPPIPIDTQQPAQVPSALPQEVLTSPSASSQPLLPFSRPKSFRVELPASNIRRDEYAEVSYLPEAPHSLSLRKKDQHNFSHGGKEPIGGRLDQSQRIEEALRFLDELMEDIFNTIGRALEGTAGYQSLIHYTSENEVTLSSFAQHKLHSAMQQAIELKCFDQVPLESLMRVMKLSDVQLKMAEYLTIRVDSDWDEAGLESWVKQLPDVETAMTAARTCMRILSGCREEKQLYSENRIDLSLKIFRMAIEDIVIPVVELRPVASTFRLLLKHRESLTSIFVCCRKLFAVFAELITKVELSPFVMSTLEFTATKLIFVENAYVEKDSAVGVQKFDGIRSVAMDMLGQIFLTKPKSRQGIINEILTSLEKLPVGKQSSRQFKLADGDLTIQPVSALLMRLVQASSGKVAESEQGRAVMKKILRDEENSDDASGDEEMEDEEPIIPKKSPSILDESRGAEQHALSIQELEAAAAPFNDDAVRNASFIVHFIVQRAIGSTKSGDTPYRNLLDLFVEDFTTCLDSPDWPSAELLLRLLMLRMVALAEAGRTAAPTKNMALEILGCMSAAISRLRSQVKRMTTPIEGHGQNELTNYLCDLATHVLEQNSQMEHIVPWTGPYRAAVEYLQSRLSGDRYLSSAISYIITMWATRVHMCYDSMQDADAERDQEMGRLAYRMRMMIENHRWLSDEYTFKTVSATQAKLAYAIVILRSPLCESFGKILNILLGSMTSDQATVRSKSLKSVNQVLETDPSILDGDSNVIQLILDCSSDSSPQVRDSALGLLGNCIGMRPKLELPLTPRIIERFQDAGIQVRKRAMKLARDIYLRNRQVDLRSAIANGLLRRVQDPDESVRDLARQMIEEVWFAPFYAGNHTTAKYETSLTEHVALIIHTVKTGNVTENLDKVLQTILRPKDKPMDPTSIAKPKDKVFQGPFSICSSFVANMFGLIDNSLLENGASSGRDALQVLTVFAKADPKLFNFEQIKLLKPHLASFGGADELAAFRAVTIIYQRVLPQLPTVVPEFLTEVRLQLLKAIGKVFSRGALDNLIACTRVVCELLGDFGPLANLVASSLTAIQKLGVGQMDSKRVNLLAAYSILVGSVGKHCDLGQQIDIFKARFLKWQGDSVPRLIVDILAPFASPTQTLDARKASLEAIGLVCQAWPRNYVLAKVYTAFQQVFQEQTPVLEAMILRSFKEFLLTEEMRSESAAEIASDGTKKELTVMGGTNFDDVASATTQRFLGQITRIALGSQDEHAFLAMEVLGSINRQGLTHPKETGVTLITLETSTNRKIAELAFSEHRSLHEKHETVLEREYMKAVQSAYTYQRDIVKDSRGATTEPFQSKLHMMMEVLKISKMRNRQRFLEKLCSLVDFDWTKLDLSGEIPPHVEFCRFVMENIAYFEYQTIGEIQTTVNTIEKIFGTTGVAVAQAVESEVLNMSISSEEAAPTQVEGSSKVEAPISGELNAGRLKQLAASSIILLLLWETRTHLRRLYGMGVNRHDSKAKALAKDLNKTPVKVQGIHGDKFWEETANHVGGFESLDKMKQQCTAFVEVMSVDKDFKVEDVDMELEAAQLSSDAEEDEEQPERGRKRKGAGAPGGRKKRARSGSQPRKRGRPRKQAATDVQDDEEDEMDWA